MLSRGMGMHTAIYAHMSTYMRILREIRRRSGLGMPGSLHFFARYWFQRSVPAALLWQTMREPVGRLGQARAGLGNALLYLAALVFVASGASKLAHASLAVEEMRLLGLTGGKYTLVAAMEIGCGLLLLVPSLRSLAALIVSAHMGGAICAHVI